LLPNRNGKQLARNKPLQAQKKLVQIEGLCALSYFREIFGLFPEAIRLEHRKGFKAYDGVNNLFNL
jgi:CRISPR/Cas system-associated endonuclease Cas1